jgi:DNA-binding response OmpR family regulator
MDNLKNARILAIDDDPQVLSLLNIILKNKCEELILHNQVGRAFEFVLHNQPDLILLDVMLDKNCGYEICKQLKTHEKTTHIPIIFLSSLALPEDKVKGFEAGAVDFISKPFDIGEVLARIRTCLKTHEKALLITPSEPPKTADFLKIYGLNKHELEILDLYIAGYKRSEIAQQVYLSENTVKWYVKQVFEKFQVNSRAELLKKINTLRS